MDSGIVREIKVSGTFLQAEQELKVPDTFYLSLQLARSIGKSMRGILWDGAFHFKLAFRGKTVYNLLLYVKMMPCTETSWPN